MLQVDYCCKIQRQYLQALFFLLNLTKFCCWLPLQILMRVEQEQKVTEDARMFAEQDAAAQRYAAQVLQVSRLFSS